MVQYSGSQAAVATGALMVLPSLLMSDSNLWLPRILHRSLTSCLLQMPREAGCPTKRKWRERWKRRRNSSGDEQKSPVNSPVLQHKRHFRYERNRLQMFAERKCLQGAPCIPNRRQKHDLTSFWCYCGIEIQHYEWQQTTNWQMMSHQVSKSTVFKFIWFGLRKEFISDPT